MCYIDNTFKSCWFSYSEVLNLVKNHMTLFHHHRFSIKQELVTLKKVPASKLLCHWWHRLLHNHLYLQRLYLHQFVLVCLSISAFASLNNYHDLYSTAQKAAPPFVVRVSGKCWNKVRCRLRRYNEDKNVPRQRRAQIGEKNVNYSHLTKHFIENS